MYFTHKNDVITVLQNLINDLKFLAFQCVSSYCIELIMASKTAVASKIMPAKAMASEAMSFETTSKTSVMVIFHEDWYLLLHHYRNLHGVWLRDRDFHGVRFRDMDWVRNGNRHLHWDLHRIRNMLLNRVRNFLLNDYRIWFGYGYWVGPVHMDRHRDLDRDRDFLLHVHWIWLRDGHFNFLGDCNGLHVTLMV